MEKRLTKDEILTPEFGRSVLKSFFKVFLDADILEDDFYNFIIFRDEFGYHFTDFVIEYEDGDYYDDQCRYVGQFEEVVEDAARKGLLTSTDQIWYSRVTVLAFAEERAVVKYRPDAFDELR